MATPTLLQPAETATVEKDERPRPRMEMGSRFGQIASLVLAAFWIGGAGAYLLGMLGGPKGMAALNLQEISLCVAVTLVPPIWFIVVAWALARGQAMASSANALVDATDRLFSADETASRTAARLGRAVRRELDALNAGLDGAFTRLRALESVLENQIASLDEAGARVDVRGEALAARLTVERERIEGVAGTLADAAARAGETVAGRTAQLKSMIEAAEGTLKSAGQSLDTQAASFRQSAGAAADAPHAAAVELDKQAKCIESVADAAMARAEFVLGRQERHRAAMNELMQKLKEDSSTFETALSAQRTGMEQAIAELGAEAQRFESTTGDAERHFELMMANASARTSQLAQNFAKEAERLRDIGEQAGGTIEHLIAALQEAGVGAQQLIGETASQAKNDARNLVGEAMAECEKLLRTSKELSTEASDIRTTLAKAVEDVERHLVTLPGIAQQESQRVRQMVATETEQILDLSARTLSTMHARTVSRPTAREKVEEHAESDEGLRGLARKLTQRGKKKPDEPQAKTWQMSTLLAAAETSDGRKDLRPAAAAALGALQAALSDLAIDLGSIASDADPHEDEWRRYLAGDRAVFARKLAATIDDGTVHRIANLYRENARFRDSANAYIEEFEALLAHAREGDGGGGLLASTILSADTGKIYLAIAYALGRL
jgi:endonuclease III